MKSGVSSRRSIFSNRSGQHGKKNKQPGLKVVADTKRTKLKKSQTNISENPNTVRVRANRPLIPKKKTSSISGSDKLPKLSGNVSQTPNLSSQHIQRAVNVHRATTANNQFAILDSPKSCRNANKHNSHKNQQRSITEGVTPKSCNAAHQKKNRKKSNFGVSGYIPIIKVNEVQEENEPVTPGLSPI